MKSSERTIAFFAAMLITFGITVLDFENPAFRYNELEYVVLGLGVVLSIVFIVMRMKR